MKRIISILCAGAVLLGSAACKSSGVANNSVHEPDSVGAAAQGTSAVGDTSTDSGSGASAAEPVAEESSSVAANAGEASESFVGSGMTEEANSVDAIEENHIPLEEKDVVVELNGEEFTTGTDSVQLTLTYVGENGGYDYTLGSEYSLEKWGDNGDWRSVPFAENVGFNAMGYLFGGTNKTTSFTVSLAEYMYAEPLTAGSYRITKPLCDGVNAYAVFVLKDIGDNGLVVEYEQGTMKYDIVEIGDGVIMCRLIFPSPVMYEVICSADLCKSFAVGDRISVEYAPMYKIDEMNYRVIAQNITLEKSDGGSVDWLDDDIIVHPDY